MRAAGGLWQSSDCVLSAGQVTIRLLAGSVAFTRAVTRAYSEARSGSFTSHEGGVTLVATWHPVHPRFPASTTPFPSLWIIVVKVMPLAFTVMFLKAVPAPGSPLLTLSCT